MVCTNIFVLMNFYFVLIRIAFFSPILYSNVFNQRFSEVILVFFWTTTKENYSTSVYLNVTFTITFTLTASSSYSEGCREEEKVKPLRIISNLKYVLK